MNYQGIQHCIKYPHHLLKFNKEDRDNTNHMRQILEKKPLALEYMSSRLQDSLDFVMIAVRKNMFALKFASEKLQNNRDFIKDLLQSYTIDLDCTKEQFRSDKELVSIALENDIMQIVSVSPDLRNDEEFILPIMLKHGKPRSFKYLGDELKNKKDVALQVVAKAGYALQYLSEDMKSDVDVVSIAVHNSGWALEDAHIKFHNNEEFIKCAVLQDASYIKKLDPNILHHDFVLQLAMVNGDTLQYVPQIFRRNPDIVLAAIKENVDDFKNISAFKYADYELKKNRAFVFEAIKIDPDAMEYASSELIQEVGNIDPVQYFTAYFLKHELEQQIPVHQVNKKRIKI